MKPLEMPWVTAMNVEGYSQLYSVKYALKTRINLLYITSFYSSRTLYIQSGSCRVHVTAFTVNLGRKGSPRKNNKKVQCPHRPLHFLYVSDSYDES